MYKFIQLVPDGSDSVSAVLTKLLSALCVIQLDKKAFD